MAIDSQNETTSLADEDLGPIENEVPAYRALSRLAVLSLVLGILSVLTFTDQNFAILGVLSIIVAVFAIRGIRRMPDVLTGEKIANAGIGLSLAFVLCSMTISLTQGWIIDRSASKFAYSYLGAMKSGSFDALLYYQAMPDGRKGKTPKQISEELIGTERSSREFEMSNADIIKLKERLKEKESVTVEYQGIERHAIDGLAVDVAALFKVTGPTSKEYPQPSSLARVVFHGVQENREYSWWVKHVEYPVVHKK